MISAATIDLAMGFVNAAVQLGRRADQILVEHEIGAPLPFALPEMPLAASRFVDQMERFFDKPEGRALLDASGRTADFDAYMVIALGQGGTPDAAFAETRLGFVHLFATLTGRRIPKVGQRTITPKSATITDRAMAMQQYVVDSAKPGFQRSAVIDIALATADVAMDYVGQNPGFITRDESMQGILRTFLTSFSAGDLETLSDRQLFERALGTVISTAMTHPELVADSAPLSIVLESLEQARGADDDGDFVAGLVAGEGFDTLLQSLLGTVGGNMGRFTDDAMVVDLLGGLLIDVSKDAVFRKVLKGDNAALALVAQVAIDRALRTPALMKSVSGSPRWRHVVGRVLGSVSANAASRTLFTGPALEGLLESALQAVGDDPALLNGDFVERLVAGLAGAVGSAPVKGLLQPAGRQAVLEHVLRVASTNVGMLVQHDELVTSMLSQVLSAAATNLGAGFDEDAAVSLAGALLETLSSHVTKLELPDELAGIIGTVVGELTASTIVERLATGQILELGTDVVDIVLSNPHLWEEIGGGALPAGVVRSIVIAVTDDPTGLLTGPTLGWLIETVVDAVADRSSAFAAGLDAAGIEDSADLTRLLSEALAVLESEIGVRVGSGNIVDIIEKLVRDWSAEKFLVSSDDAAFITRVSNTITAVA